MGTTVAVDAGQLRRNAATLKRTSGGRRPSADETDGFGSQVARGAVHRFERYWVLGQSTVDGLVVALAGALEQAADAYERRDAQDAVGFRSDQGGFHGF